MKNILNIRKGFSVIELMIVVIVMGIVSLTLLQGYIWVMSDSKRGAAKKNCRIIADAVRRFMADNDTFPEDLSELKGKYLTDMKDLRDPWGSPYMMAGDFIFSFGQEDVNRAMIGQVLKELKELGNIVPALLRDYESGLFSLKFLENKIKQNVKDPWGNYYHVYKGINKELNKSEYICYSKGPDPEKIIKVNFR